LRRLGRDAADGGPAELIERIAELALCKTHHALMASTCRILQRFGVSGFFLFELDCPANFLSTMGNLPKGLVEGIRANGFHNADLVLRHLLAQRRRPGKPLFRSVVDEHVFAAEYEPPVFLRHKEFVTWLRSFGIVEIYYHPFAPADGKGASSVFCLWQKGNPDILHGAVQRLGEDVALLAAQFERVAKTRFPLAYRRSTQLIISGIKRETLRILVEKDISAGTVALLRGVHEVTVNKQIADVKRALGVSTLTGLIVEAIKSGLVTIDGI